MKKYSVIFLTLFYFILFNTHVTIAQEYKSYSTEQEQAKDTKYKVGPFRLFPSIYISNLGYDNNVYNMLEKNDPISDFTATFSFPIKVYSLYRNWFLFSFFWNPEYVLYLDQTSLRGWNNTFSPEIRLQFLNNFVLSANYFNRKRRYRFTSEIDVPVYEKVRMYGGSVFYETDRGSSFGLLAMMREINYEDIAQPGEEIPLSQSLDRREKNGSFELYYRVFSKSQLFFIGGYSEYNFNSNDSKWRDSYSYQTYIGLKLPIIGRAKGNLTIGYKKLVPREESYEGFLGIVGSSNIDFRSGRFGFRLRYERDTAFSFTRENIYFLESVYGFGISIYTAQFMRLDYNFDYGLNEYPEFVSVQLPDRNSDLIKRRDKNQNHSVGIIFRIRQNVGIGVNVYFWRRNSNYPGVHWNRAFIGLNITYDF